MKKSHTDTELFRDAASELGVEASYVEKDWYAVEVLKHISAMKEFQIIFTGGTSLSKGYKLINRFSEDLDFKISSTITCTRSMRRDIRKKIINKIEEIPDVEIEDSILVRNESKFFSIKIEYPNDIQLADSLRPHLKLEFSFDEPRHQIEEKSISSFITELTNATPDCSINLISPIEIAADKLSALIWRINIKNRDADYGTNKNDPTIIRHLHDLSSLEVVLKDNGNSFIGLVKSAYEKDRGRGGSEKSMNLKELLEDTIIKLKEDSVYLQEYTRYVEAMSYAKEEDRISYVDALKSLENISALLY